MQEINKENIDKRMKILEERAKLDNINPKNLPFHMQIQQDPKREEKIEKLQKEVFFNLISKKEELKHLKEEQEELFIEFWLDFLKGECKSINEFLYINGEVETNDEKVRVKDFLDKNHYNFKYKLKKRFIKEDG